MFNDARLRLTLWYLAILGAIVAMLSLVIYRILLSLQDSELRALGTTQRHGIAGLFARDEGTLVVQILALDAGVLILAALGAYVLAGRTLTPIEQAMDRQQRFAAAASHELRTPLTVLRGSMEVALLNPRAPEEYENILRHAAAEATRMGELVADLLALARTQHDGDLLSRDLLDLGEVAREAAESIRPLAEHKRQTLEVNLDRSLLVLGDALKLRQIVIILLDNAVAYTPAAGVIQLTGRRERHHVLLAVRDNGHGIAMEHLPRLFEPFYRVDPAWSGDAAHTGLGLALAAWIARAHHGQIAVESQVQVGTVFTLKLPAVTG
ncbi:MAG TPA: ATP-binding protein [Chloroflexota bacterium]|nr:ATP-binding protein [Chloroflexota bacterium]